MSACPCTRAPWVQVRVMYTAPTLLRSLMQYGDEWVTSHSRSSLRILGTVGEPINPHAWNWFNEVREAPAHQADASHQQPYTAAEQSSTCNRPAGR